jgi:hypothetical protein
VKIDIDETSSTKTALIHFEKLSAAKTALMVRLSLVPTPCGWYHSESTQLNGSILDSRPLTVYSETVHGDDSEEDSGTSRVPGAPLEQSDKPRAGSMYPSYLVLQSAHDS